METLRSQRLFASPSCTDSIFFGLCRQYLPTSVEDPTGANSSCQNCSSRCQTCDGPSDNQCTSCVQGLALSHGKILFHYLPKGHEIMTTISSLICGPIIFINENNGAADKAIPSLFEVRIYP